MAIDTISRALSGQASTAAKQAKETADSAMEQAIAAVPGAVSDWLEDNVTPTTPVVDASLSIAGAAADAKATGDGIADLKSALNTEIDVTYFTTEKDESATLNSFKLVDSGLATQDVNYKLVKYALSLEKTVIVVSDNKWQFQNSPNVPISGSSNRVGETYGAGTFAVDVPEGATYVIISTPAENSVAKLYNAESVKDGLIKNEEFTEYLSDAFSNSYVKGANKLSSGDSASYFGWLTRWQALTKDKYYVFELETTTNIDIPDIKIGTNQTARSMVKTIGENVSLQSGGKWISTPVLANVSGIGYMRISANNTNLTLNIYEIATDKYNSEIEKVESEVGTLSLTKFIEYVPKVPGGIYYSTSPTTLDVGKMYCIVLKNNNGTNATLSDIKVGTSDTAASMVLTVDTNVTINAYSTYHSPVFKANVANIQKIRTGNTTNITCSLMVADVDKASLNIESITKYCVPNNVKAKYAERSDILSQLSDKKMLLVFTDIHGSKENFDRLEEWHNANIPNLVSDAIVLGDMVNDSFNDSMDFMNTPLGNATLKVIGNHDVLLNGSIPGVTSKQAYDKYLAPNIANWGVTQPEDASTDGKCYYYKDYDNVRLIVLDTYFYTQAQNTWFSDVLNNALTNEKTVIVAEHEDICTSDEKQPFNSNYPFARKQNGFTGLQYRTVGDGGDYRTKRDLVDNFIDNNGDFACWLCGHMHSDMSGYYQGTHGKQMSILLNGALIAGEESNVRIRGYSQDCFTYLGVDTTNKYLYLCRIGQTVDRWGHKNEYLVINYTTGEVVEYH